MYRALSCAALASERQLAPQLGLRADATLGYVRLMNTGPLMFPFLLPLFFGCSPAPRPVAVGPKRLLASASVTQPVSSKEAPVASARAARSAPPVQKAVASKGAAERTSKKVVKSTTQVPLEKKLALRWERKLKQPSLHFSAGKRRRAVLVGEPGAPRGVWMYDRKRWRELSFPAKLLASKGGVDHLQIYFGRDDRPRAMGYRQRNDGQRQLYYRWKGNWRSKAGEIGRLDGGKSAALFGILGHDDPEVVCKLGDICIIKRLSGWTMVPVPKAIHRVTIAGGVAYAVGPRSALFMKKKDKRWRPLGNGATWDVPTAVSATADGRVFVCSKEHLHRLDGGVWAKEDLPLKSCRALWLGPRESLWIVSKDGLARREASGWKRLKSPCSAIHHAVAVGESVWLSCRSGLWHHHTPTSAAKTVH